MTSDHSYALKAYHSAAIQMRPLVAVVRLYDETLRRIERAIKDTRAEQVEDAYINITKACMVMRGLASNLDFEQAPDMAQTLKSTYVANMIALHRAFGKPDALNRYIIVMEGLLNLRNAWANIAGIKEIPSLSQDILTIVLDNDISSTRKLAPRESIF